MAAFHAFYSANGKATNLAEEGENVTLVFTDPPQAATNVEVTVVEAAEGKESKQERELVTFSGLFQGGQFNLTSFKTVSQGVADPQRKPVITITFGGVSNTVDLPSNQEENGRFDLRLDVKGVVAGKKVSEKNIALLHVTFKRDVLVIPDADGRADETFHFIRSWAQQWKKHAPATRAIVEMKVDPKPLSSPLIKADYNEFLKSLTQAAKLAHGGKVILSVGHGDDGTTDDPPPGQARVNRVAWTNLVPEDRAPDSDDVYHYRLEINDVDMNDGLPVPPGGVLKNKTPAHPVKLNALSELGDQLNALNPKPEELRFHTCNVGGNRTFCQLLADRIQIPVTAHTDFIKYQGFGVGTMFAFYEADDKKPRQESEKTELPVSRLTAKFAPGTQPLRFP